MQKFLVFIACDFPSSYFWPWLISKNGCVCMPFKTSINFILWLTGTDEDNFFKLLYAAHRSIYIVVSAKILFHIIISNKFNLDKFFAKNKLFWWLMATGGCKNYNWKINIGLFNIKKQCPKLWWIYPPPQKEQFQI